MALAGLTAGVAILTLIHGWRADIGGRRRPTAITLGVLLCLAVALSIYDAIDNIVVRVLEPIAHGSWLWLFMFDLLLPIWAIVLIRSWRARDKAEARLASLAYADPVTGLWNRRGFVDHAVKALALARRSGIPSSVVMLDLDHFKAINDRLGHAGGDLALNALAITLQSELRAGDLLARLGGDEFVVLLPGCDAAAAQLSAMRWRLRLRDAANVPNLSHAGLQLSAGVAEVAVHGEPEAALTIACGAADAALYDAKRLGRDRVELATTP